MRGFRALLVTGLLLAAGCGGGGSGSPRSFPVAALSIPPVAGAPVDTVNIATVATAMIEAELTDDSRSDDVLTLTLEDSLGQTVTAVGGGTDGAGFANFGPLDLSPLSDGMFTARIEVAPASGGSLGVDTLGSFRKDTVAPAPPSATEVKDVAGNPAGSINENNVDHLVVEITRGGGFEAGETIEVCFTDGAVEMCSTISMPTSDPDPVASVPPLDLSPLLDGPLTATLRLTDDAGNVTTVSFGPFSKDTFVAAPVSAAILGTPTPDIVNQTNVLSVTVEIVLPAGSRASDTILVRVLDGTTTVSGTIAAPSGGGTIQAGGINATALAEGNLALLLRVTDDHGNVAEFTGTPAFKDTIIGDATSVEVAAGTDNAAGVINQASASAAFLTVDVDAVTISSDTITVILEDPMGVTLTTTSPAASGPAAVTIGPLDTSSLGDGAISLTAMIEDAAGNASPTRLGTALRDTTSPPQPTSVSVPAGMNNPTGIVNSMTASATRIDVLLPAGSSAGDTLRIDVADVTTTLTFTSTVTGSGVHSASGLDLSTLVDGPIVLGASVIDVNGNASAVIGGSATLDRAVVAPTSATVRSGPGNATGFVSLGNQSSATLDLVFPGGSVASDQLTGVFDVGGTTVSLGTVSGVGGGGLATVGGLDLSSLPDGNGTIHGSVTDTAGNVVPFGPFAFTKDTVAPDAPSLLRVAAGTSNTTDEINQSNVGGVNFDVVWNASADGSEIAVLHVTDGISTLSVPPVTLPVGGGPGVLGPVNTASLSDGSVSLSIDITDPAGNVTTFAGTTANKDTGAPPAPTASHVAAGAGNPQDFVNASSQASVTVEVVLPAGYAGTESVSISLSDGASVVAPPAQTAPGGGGTMTFAGVDVSLLADGTLTLAVTASDVAGNSTIVLGTPPQKDTIAPAAPSALGVAAGTSNPADAINAANESTVSFDVTWDASMTGAETATITIDDGVGTIRLLGPLTPPSGGGSEVVGVVDASPLSDGAIAVSVDLADPAGNVTTFAGTTAMKNTVSPASPTSASVASGPSNPADVINLATASTVEVTVVLGAGSLASDSIQVTLDDGTSQASSAMMNGTAGAGSLSFTGIDASLLAEGPITVLVDVTDATGNTTSFTGTAALKDVTPPAAPTAAGVAAGLQNAVDFINAASASQVVIEIALGASSLASDTVSATLDDGTSTIMTPAAPATTGAGTLTLASVSCAGLLDGAISIAVDVTDAAGNITAFAGRTASKDTVAPAAPISGHVAAGGSNPIDYINAASQSSTDVDVTLPASYDGSEVVSVLLSDGSGPLVVSPGIAAPSGGGTVMFTGLVTSGLADGTVSLFVDVRDAAGNITKQNATPAIKDVVAPALPTTLRVAAGAMNVQDQIVAASVASVVLDVVWDASMDGAEATLTTLTDSLSATATIGPVAPPVGGGADTLGPIDLSAFADGAVTLSMSLTDPAGNVSTFAGTTATKSSTAPDPPLTAGIAAGPSNAADVVNSSSVNAIDVVVAYGASADAADQVVVKISDGVLTITSMPLASPSGAGSITFAGIDVSTLADGTLTIVVETTDPATNTTVFSGTMATKDTVAPDAPTAANVPMTGSNPVDFVNLTTQGSVVVATTLPGTYSGTETLEARLDDGVNPPVASASLTAPVGGGPISFAGINVTGLLDGPLAVVIVSVDPAGNSTTFTGTTATKDTVAPTAPGTLAVASGAGNAADVVNASNSGAASFDLTWDMSMVGDESANLTVTSSGGGSAALGPITAPGGGGAATLGPLDLTGLGDGTLTLTFDLTDPAGNVTMFTGTPATKDVAPPAPPSSATVAAGGGNGAGEINQSNEGAVAIDVSFPASSDPANTVVVILSDGMTMVMSTAMNAPMGAGMLTFPGLDATGLTEGAIIVQVELTDPSGNVTTFTATPATKDVTPAAPPTNAEVAATANNPVDFINATSEGVVRVEITIPASYAGDESVTVTLDDGVNPVVTAGPATAPVGGGVMAFTGIDATSLAEGAVTLQIDVVDGTGNPTTFAGTSATKDVTAPVAPSALSVPAGANNPSDVINAAIENAVNLAVTWDASMLGNETATVDFTSSGGGTASSAPVAPPVGGGADMIGPTDVSAISDGTVTLSLTLTDPAGNATPFVGTAALKDTVGPANPTSANVAAGMNNPIDGINTNNEAAVILDVAFGAGTDASDVVFVTLSDGVLSVMTSTLNAPAMAGTLTFPSIDVSAFADGVVTVTVELADVYGNTTIFAGTTATKSGLPPAPIVSAHVAMTMQNPVDYINAVTEGSVTVEVVTPMSYVGTESIVVTLGDGVNPAIVSMAMTSPVGMGSVVFTGLDLSSLNQGMITLDVDVTDGAGNMATYAGTAATKDITAPTAPSSLGVASGMDNAADLINMHSEAAVVLDVVWDASMVGDESATVEFQDTATGSVFTAAVSPPASGGAATIGPTDVTALIDGAITLDLTLTDPAGNVTTFTGTPAVKDIVGPDVPTDAYVAMGGSNAQHVVNPSNDAAVVLEVVLAAGSVATDQVTVTLSDGTLSVSTATLAAPMGAGTLTFAAIDASTLAEGTLTVSVELVDANNNITTFAGTSALKDTVAPLAPTSARVESGPSNPQDYINEFTEGSADVTVVLPGSYDGTEQVTVSLDDGVLAPVTSSSQTAAVGGGSLVFTGLDVSALADGALTLTVDVVDGGGNTGSFGGTPPTKDTVDPDATAGRVPFQQSHPENYVSRFDQSSVTAEVDWGAMADGSEGAIVAFDDGATTIMTASMAATVGVGTVTYAGTDLSTLDDGALTMTITATDVAGNVATIVVNVFKYANELEFTRNLYAVNRDDDTISMFLVDVNTGQLRANGFVTTGTRPVDLDLDALFQYAYTANETSNDVSIYTIASPAGNLVSGGVTAAGTAPVAVAVDSRGRFAYAINSGSNDVSAFTITTGTGALSGGAVTAAGTTPADGGVDPSDQYLVVCNVASNDLMSFAINQGTGALMSASTLGTGTAPASLAFHPSGRFVYTANGTSDDITVATLDPATGALALVSNVPAGTMPTCVTVTPDGAYLYCTNGISDDVSLYSINQTTGDLTSLAAAVSAGTGPSAVRSSTSADYLYVANETSNDVTVYTIGSGTGLLTEVAHGLTQSAPVDLEIVGGDTAVGFVLRYAYVGNKASNDVSTHTINDMTGALTPLGSPTAAGTDPISLVTHPLGSWLYCANEVSDDVTTYSVNATTGALTQVGSPVATGGGPKDIAVSPSGRFLYVANGDTDDVSGYSINQTTGALTSLGATTLTDVEPVASVVSSNGKFLYVACQGSDTVRAYSIDPSTGVLAAVGVGQAVGIIPIDIEVHPSGSFVYVVNRGTGDIYLFDADVNTGALSFNTSFSAGSQPFGFAITPLGDYAYAVNRTSQDVTAYSINQSTGALSAIGGTIAAGTDSRTVAIDPRGEYAYVTDFAASGPGVVYVYAINQMTGALSSLGTHAAGGSGSSSLVIISDIL